MNHCSETCDQIQPCTEQSEPLLNVLNFSPIDAPVRLQISWHDSLRYAILALLDIRVIMPYINNHKLSQAGRDATRDIMLY